MWQYQKYESFLLQDLPLDQYRLFWKIQIKQCNEKKRLKSLFALSSLGAKYSAAIKRADIRRRNPYHTRHTYACWMLTTGTNPSFIASQMGHQNAQMVYKISSTWMQDTNGDQISMLNQKLAL